MNTAKLTLLYVTAVIIGYLAALGLDTLLGGATYAP